MKKLTLSNSFHNTSTTVLISDSQAEDAGFDYIESLRDRIYRDGDNNAKRQMNRIWNALCGVSGCTCGMVR